MKQEQDTATRGGIWMGRHMKWETDGEKQMREDTHKVEQAKESETTAKADWWLKTHELGDRWIRRQMVREKWLEPSESKEKTSGQPDKTSQSKPEWETYKGKHVKREPDNTSQNGRHH